MADRNRQFIPEIVDEQIDQIKYEQRGQQPMAPQARILRDLHYVYAEDARSLERVWTRMQERIAADNRSVQNEGFSRQTANVQRFRQERHRSMQQGKLSLRKTPSRYLGLIAAVLFAALLVGSLAWILMLARAHGIGTAAPHINSASPPGVYVASAGGVYRLDVKTGKPIWRYSVKAAPDAEAFGIPPNIGSLLPFYRPAVVAGDTVYASSADRLYALDARSGALHWSHEFKMLLGAPYIADGKLYISAVVNEGGYIYALDPTTGAVRTRYHVNANPLSFIEAKGVFYVASFRDLYALRIKDGTQLWHIQISDQQNFGAPIVLDGVLYISSTHVKDSVNSPQDSYTYAFNASTGAKIWQSIDMTGFVVNAPVVSNGVVYCGAHNGFAYAFSARTGKLLWRFNAGGPVAASPVAVNGIVYIVYALHAAATGGEVLAWNPASGAVLWRKSLSYLSYAPLIVSDGVIYVSIEKRAYALNTSNGAIIWQFQDHSFWGIAPQLTVIAI